MKKRSIIDLHRITSDEYKKADKIPLTVILDHVRSLYNVGSIFRTGDAFRIESLCLCGITAVPPHAEIHKTALGAEDSVDWHYYKDTMQAVEELKGRGYHVFSVEQVEESISLQNFTIDKTQKYAVVLGNEVRGVQQAVVDVSDGSIEIPQFGTKHSLNVSVAAGIVIWYFAKQFLDIGYPGNV